MKVPPYQNGSKTIIQKKSRLPLRRASDLTASMSPIMELLWKLITGRTPSNALPLSACMGRGRNRFHNKDCTKNSKPSSC